jgi:hypothetical protein
MQKAPFSFWKRLKEIDMFFQKRDPVHKAMRALINRLVKAGIPYAVVGGMAVNAHGHRRTTDDVDLLVTADGLAEFQRRYVPRYYESHPRARPRFTERARGITIDFLVTGRFPGSGAPGPIAYPNPEGLTQVIEDAEVLDLPTLIQLKLAARRHQDFADVVNLISTNDLDESLLCRLHPTVRQDFIECLEEKRREDEYEERGHGH